MALICGAWPEAVGADLGAMRYATDPGTQGLSRPDLGRQDLSAPDLSAPNLSAPALARRTWASRTLLSLELVNAVSVGGRVRSAAHGPGFRLASPRAARYGSSMEPHR